MNPPKPGIPGAPLLLCFSHLRWDFVFQRPQHLLSRAAQTHHVIFFEEPVSLQAGAGLARMHVRATSEGVTVATPMLPEGLDEAAKDEVQRELLDEMLRTLPGGPQVSIAWYYTPMALAFAAHLQPDITVYDCMDELSGFRGASPRLTLLERRLLRAADLVFAGGYSLYEAKRQLHPQAHLFPSGVDTAHFGRARSPDLMQDTGPADQAALPRPRLGWFGVIDERMDLALLDGVAEQRPHWSLVMIGPVVKIDPASLPRRPNIHWLGSKPHGELPAYLAGWDIGMMPFALNEATRFISPTKTPEYLAGGVPVVSTAVPDVVHDWGRDGLVSIAADVKGFITAAEAAMARPRAAWLPQADLRLDRQSWDSTWASMEALARQVAARRQASGSLIGPQAAVSEPPHV
jgi:UDP-galactopyranose mutase